MLFRLITSICVALNQAVISLTPSIFDIVSGRFKIDAYYKKTTQAWVKVDVVDCFDNDDGGDLFK